MSKLNEKEVIELLKNASYHKTTNRYVDLTSDYVLHANYVVDGEIEIYSRKIFLKPESVFYYPQDCDKQEGYITLLIRTKFPCIFNEYKHWKNAYCLPPPEEENE